MERMKDEIYHGIKLVRGVAFLEIAERAIKEYEQNPDKTYPQGYFTQLSIEAQDKGWLFLLKEPYEERYNNLQTRLYHIIKEEEQKSQKIVKSQSSSGLVKKILRSLNPFKQEFKGVAI